MQGAGPRPVRVAATAAGIRCRGRPRVVRHRCRSAHPADDGELLLKLRRLAGRAGGHSGRAHQRLEGVAALVAGVFEDGHGEFGVL